MELLGGTESIASAMADEDAPIPLFNAQLFKQYSRQPDFRLRPGPLECVVTRQDFRDLHLKGREVIDDRNYDGPLLESRDRLSSEHTVGRTCRTYKCRRHNWRAVVVRFVFCHADCHRAMDPEIQKFLGNGVRETVAPLGPICLQDHDPIRDLHVRLPPRRQMVDHERVAEGGYREEVSPALCRR